MLLTIRTTYRPATDLGFLFHKDPEHVHTREFPFGNATVFGGSGLGPEFHRSAAAVSPDAHAGAESSRDVSDSTSLPTTLTPRSVTGSLTSRLRV
jgi:RNA repair, ligase-Pnkp-associating, region of Hen1